jgi:hypothetical protein
MSAVAPVRATPARPRPGRASAAVPRPQPTPARPQLKVVAPARPAFGALPFAVVVSGILGAGLVVLLMLHTLAAQDAFTVHKLQRQSATLGDVEQQLALANQQAQAPSALAARARALGMVPTGTLQIVRHRDGRIVAVSSALPVPVATPSRSAAASQPGAATASSGPAAPSASATPAPTTSTGATKPAKHRAKPRQPH